MALKKTQIGASLQLYLGKLFSSLPFTPTQITLSSVLFAALGFYFASQSLPYHALAFFVFAGIVDAIDGAVARSKKMVSERGAYIDGITDRLVELLFILSFFFFPLPPFLLPASLSLIIFLFFGSALSSFATAYAEHRHVADSKKIARQPGILPRAERLIVLFAAFALVPSYSYLSSVLLLIGAALSVVTFFQRFFYFAEN